MDLTALKVLLILAWLEKKAKTWVDINSDWKYLPDIFLTAAFACANLIWQYKDYEALSQNV